MSGLCGKMLRQKVEKYLLQNYLTLHKQTKVLSIVCSKITKLFTSKQKYCLSCAAKLLNSSQENKYCLSCAAKLLNSSQENKSIVYHVQQNY